METKHFNWSFGDRRGRVGIALSDGRVIISQIGGQAPPVEILPHLIDEMGAEFHQITLSNNEDRRHEFAIETRRGMSCCYDVLLIERRDEILKHYPIVASLHVSMEGRLNQKVSMWPGDLAILIDAIAFDEKVMGEIFVEEAEIKEYAWQRINFAVNPLHEVEVVANK